jgi:hypothetical protein
MDYVALRGPHAAQYSKFGLPTPGSMEGALASIVGINKPPVYNKISSFADGTSNTLLATEDVGRPDNYEQRAVHPTRKVTGAGWPESQAVSLMGYNADGTWGPGTNSFVSSGPCMVNCNNNSSAYSFHTGGVNALSADGSVRFLRDSVSAATMCAMLTRMGGEVIDSSQD